MTSSSSTTPTTALDRVRSAQRITDGVIPGIVTTGVWIGIGVGFVGSTSAVTPGIAAGTTAMLILNRRSSRHRLIRSFTQDVGDVMIAVVAALAAGVVVSTVTTTLVPLAMMALIAAITPPLLLVTRSMMARSHVRSRPPKRLVVIGAGEDGAELVRLVTEHPEGLYALVGVIGHRPTAELHGLDAIWIGDTDELSELLDVHAVDTVMLTATGFRSPHFRRILATAERVGVEVFLSSGVARIGTHRVQVDGLVHEPLVEIGWQSPGGGQLRVRRLLDIIGASVGLAVVAPVMLTAAVVIKLGDRGPVLYRSTRVGRDGETFGMLKFRSMRPDADRHKNDLANRNERSGPLFKISNDPRITPIGRIIRETSIDELPQLINVLRGEMSLVGPRPALPEEAAVFDPELRRRFDVRPGITGLWQVEARSNAEFGAYRRLDLHYVANWSLWLDVQILVATVVQIVTSALMLPLSLTRQDRSADGITPTSVARVIDLRTKTEPLTAPRHPDREAPAAQG